MDFPLFDPEWSAQDDIALLKGISQSGIDNWIEISDQFGSKTPEDWEAQFYWFYYKSKDDPIPKFEEIGTLTRDKASHEPITKDAILKSGKERKKSLKQKLNINVDIRQKSKSRSRKNEEDNSDDPLKQQGKFLISH